jgi:hypothetical protein
LDTEVDKEENEGNNAFDMDNEGVKENLLENLAEEFDKSSSQCLSNNMESVNYN